MPFMNSFTLKIVLTADSIQNSACVFSGSKFELNHGVKSNVYNIAFFPVKRKTRKKSSF